MKCKLAEYYISLYLDSALDEAVEELLFEHIRTCEHCSTYWEQSKEMHKLATKLFEEESADGMPSSASIMEDIYKGKAFHRARGIRIRPVAVAAVLAIVILLVPIHSKTVLAYGIDWVRSLVIREPGLVMMVEDRDTAMSHEVKGGKTVVLKEENQYLKTEEEVLSVAYKAEKKPCLPVDMVEGYTFDGAIYGRYTNGNPNEIYIESYYIKQEDPSTQKDNITVNLRYGVYVSGFKAAVSENEVAKEIIADDVRGILIKREPNNGFIIYEAYFILNKQGAVMKIKHRTKEEPQNIEADIIKIAASLLEKIKKEVPEREKPEAKSVSTVYESDKEEEFYSKIVGLDDRIVKLSAIPEGYAFEHGTFVDNPKEIDMFSLSSDFHATYIKGTNKLFILLQLHTHTEKYSDFETHDSGEVVRRDPLAGYTARVYQETISSNGIQNGRSISVDMPDYAATITVQSTDLNGDLMSDQEIQAVLTSIIEDIKEKAAKRQSVSLGRKIKIYDNLQQFINSEEVKKEGFVIPSYIPENSFFYNARHETNQYMLQLGIRLQESSMNKKIQPVITINMRKADMPFVDPFMDEKDVKNITVAGRSAYLSTRTSDSRNDMKFRTIKLQVDLTDKGLHLDISEIFNADQQVSEAEIIKIAESILKQIK